MHRRSSSQTRDGFRKWQPDPWTAAYEKAQRRHRRAHRAQLAFDATIVATLLAAALIWRPA